MTPKHVENIFKYGLLAVFLLLPIHKELANGFLAITGIAWAFVLRNVSIDGKTILARPLLKNLAAFFALLLVSVAFSLNVAQSGREWLRMLSYVMGYIMLVSVVSHVRLPIVNYLRAYIIGCSLASAYAISVFWRTKQLYVAALYGHHAMFGVLLEFVLPLIVLRYLETTIRSERVYLLLAFLVNVVALILTQARGPWIGAGVGIAVIVLLYGKQLLQHKKWCIGFGCGTVLLLGVLAPVYWPRLQTITDWQAFSNYHRLLIWQSTLQMIMDRPVWGVGLGLFPEVYNQTYISPLSLERFHPHAHNSFLMLAAEAGVLVLAAYSALLLKVARLWLQAWSKATCRQRPYIAFCIAITISIVINSLVDNFLWMPHVSKLLWLFWGIGVYSRDMAE